MEQLQPTSGEYNRVLMSEKLGCILCRKMKVPRRLAVLASRLKQPSDFSRRFGRSGFVISLEYTRQREAQRRAPCRCNLRIQRLLIQNVDKCKSLRGCPIRK